MNGVSISEVVSLKYEFNVENTYDGVQTKLEINKYDDISDLDIPLTDLFPSTEILSTEKDSPNDKASDSSNSLPSLSSTFDYGSDSVQPSQIDNFHHTFKTFGTWS